MMSCQRSYEITYQGSRQKVWENEHLGEYGINRPSASICYHLLLFASNFRKDDATAHLSPLAVLCPFFTRTIRRLKLLTPPHLRYTYSPTGASSPT
eukprot:1040497-Prorocentrum_minimum.AAC.1